MKMFNFWIAFHPDDFLMAAQLMISEHGFSWWLYTKLCIGYGDPFTPCFTQIENEILI